MLCIRNVQGVMKDHIVPSLRVIVNETIQWIGADEGPLPDCPIVDGGGAYLSPGLIDLHIHGFLGADVLDGDSDSLRMMAVGLTKYGVTSFLPTIQTAPWKEMENALKQIPRAMDRGIPGAEVLGAYLEGPFINPNRKGSQNALGMIPADFRLLEPWLECLRIITVAPEMPGVLDLLDQLGETPSVIPALGHTDCSYELAEESWRRGVRHVTHCFNGMAPFHHRTPGAVGFALSHPVTTEFIFDKVHIHPGLFEPLLKLKSLEYVVPISDSMRAGGLEDGEYLMGPHSVAVRDNRVQMTDGTLAGSILTLNQGLQHMKTCGGCTLVDGIRMGATTPATVLGISHKKGALAVGHDADLWIHTEAFEPLWTFCGGRVVYSRDGFR